MTTMTKRDWATNPILELNDYLKAGRYAWSDQYHDSPHANSGKCCIVCGKRTTDNKIQVVLGLGGSSLIHPSDYEAAESEDNGFMGIAEVGPECGKGIPVEYRWGVMA